MARIENPYIEFKVISNLYSEEDNEGKQKLIKSNVATKISIHLEDIHAHEEVFNKRGKVLKRFCRIYHTSIGAIVIAKPYNYISALKKDYHHTISTKQVGFK